MNRSLSNCEIARKKGFHSVSQLNDRDVYVSLEQDPTKEMIKKVNDRVKRLHDERHINDSTLDYLLINSDARAGKFYLLPKIHKKGCPGRPVMSGCNTPTEKLSEFVNAQLKPLVPRIASYVQDSNDMLRKLKDMERLPENAILVTIDVVVLHPHIPHEEGLQAIRRALDQREDPMPFFIFYFLFFYLFLPGRRRRLLISIYKTAGYCLDDCFASCENIVWISFKRMYGKLPPPPPPPPVTDTHAG